MTCEMCGKATGTRRYMVDQNVMNLGMCCSRFGQAMDAAKPTGQAAVQQGLERRAQRMTSKSVFTGDEKDLVADFGKRIQAGRMKKNVTKESLGAKVHARVPELNKFEAGQLRPTEAQAKALERELGITLFETVSGGPGTPAPKAAGGKGLTIGDILKDAMDKQ